MYDITTGYNCVNSTAQVPVEECWSDGRANDWSTYSKSWSEQRQMQAAALSHSCRQLGRQLWLSAVKTYNTYLSATGGELWERLTKNNVSTEGEWRVDLVVSQLLVLCNATGSGEEHGHREWRKWMWRHEVKKKKKKKCRKHFRVTEIGRKNKTKACIQLMSSGLKTQTRCDQTLKRSHNEMERKFDSVAATLLLIAHMHTSTQ